MPILPSLGENASSSPAKGDLGMLASARHDSSPRSTRRIAGTSGDHVAECDREANLASLRRAEAQAYGRTEANQRVNHSQTHQPVFAVAAPTATALFSLRFQRTLLWGARCQRPRRVAEIISDSQPYLVNSSSGWKCSKAWRRWASTAWSLRTSRVGPP